MLQPTTEYFIKTCLFCCHNQQQIADTTNNRMLHILIKWASSWDYGTYHIGDQQRLRRACAFAPSRQSLRLFAHMKYGSRRKGPSENQTSSPTAAHACLKNEFMEDDKYHNLMSWLKYSVVGSSIFCCWPNGQLALVPCGYNRKLKLLSSV